MAEMQLTTDERLKLTYEMRVPQIIELLDMSEQTLQKVRQKKLNLQHLIIHAWVLFWETAWLGTRSQG